MLLCVQPKGHFAASLRIIRRETCVVKAFSVSYVTIKADFSSYLGRVSTFLNRCESTYPEHQISSRTPRIFRRKRRLKNKKGKSAERLLQPRLMWLNKSKLSKFDDLPLGSMGFCDTFYPSDHICEHEVNMSLIPTLLFSRICMTSRLRLKCTYMPAVQFRDNREM
jgi:hypothetical protein